MKLDTLDIQSSSDKIANACATRFVRDLRLDNTCAHRVDDDGRRAGPAPPLAAETLPLPARRDRTRAPRGVVRACRAAAPPRRRSSAARRRERRRRVAPRGARRPTATRRRRAPLQCRSTSSRPRRRRRPRRSDAPRRRRRSWTDTARTACCCLRPAHQPSLSTSQTGTTRDQAPTTEPSVTGKKLYQNASPRSQRSS